MQVYRCSWAAADEACGLYFVGETYKDGSPQVFGNDGSYDECHHMWDSGIAAAVAARWNQIELQALPIKGPTP